MDTFANIEGQAQGGVKRFLTVWCKYKYRKKKIHNIKLSIAARYYYSSSCGGTAWFTLYFSTIEERKFAQELVDNVSFEKNKKNPNYI